MCRLYSAGHRKNHQDAGFEPSWNAIEVAMQVLVVDDDDFALSVVQNTMMRLGYTAVTAKNGAEALEILHTTDIRLVITDWDMPQMNGVDFCRAVRREDMSGYVYI